MTIKDEAAIANRRLWEEEVKKGCGFTLPWLGLDVSLSTMSLMGSTTPA